MISTDLPQKKILPVTQKYPTAVPDPNGEILASVKI
jgi:hypothetical protein